MPTIPFAEWTPDEAALGNHGSIRIINAIPGPTSYKPFRAHSALTNATDTRPRGAIEARDKDGNVFQYAGDTEKLYRLIGTDWTDASWVYGYTGDVQMWDMVRWKNRILATNWNEAIQYIDLGGTEFDYLTLDFRCKRLAVVRDHVIAANTFDADDSNMPDRVRWSAFDDETDWTVDPSTQSDYRDLKAGGPIQRVLGGEFGQILSERSVFRMDWEGSPTVFRIVEVLPGIGLLAPGAVTRIAETSFFFSHRGFVALSWGTGVAFPGAGKFDQTLLNDIDGNYLHRISAAADPNSNRVFFAYPGAGNVSGRPNKMFVYDRALNKATIVEDDLELLWNAGGIGFTMEQLDTFSASLDDLEVTLDSSQWQGGSQKLAGFNSDFESGFFDGENMQAVIDTRETELHEGHVTTLGRFTPLIDGATVTAEIATRNSQSDEATFGASVSQNSSGGFDVRSTAAYHRFRLTISGDWTDAIGVHINNDDATRAGRRRGS